MMPVTELEPLWNVYPEPQGGEEEEKTPVYLWLWLLPSGHDLYLDRCDNVSDGEIPDWLDFELTQSGVDGIIHDAEWKSETGTWVYWGLTRGIGPGQPFCVRVYPPRFVKYGGYDGPVEYDIEWDYEIVKVMPRSDRGAAMSWQRFFDARRRGEEKRHRIAEELRRKREKDIGAMFLHWRPYFARGQSVYDDMEMPNGVRVSLCSKHERLHYVNLGWDLGVWGEDDDGSHEKAMDQLIAAAKVKLPHLNPEAIRKLPRRW